VEWLWCRIDRQAYLSRDSLYLETGWEKLWIDEIRDEIGDITDILIPRSDI